MLRLFSCAYWPFVYLLWRNVYSSLLAIFVIRLFILSLSFSSLNVLDINPLSGTWFINISLHLLSCFFQPFHCVLWCMEIFNFDIVWFLSFLKKNFAVLWCYIQELFPNNPFTFSQVCLLRHKDYLQCKPIR